MREEERTLRVAQDMRRMLGTKGAQAYCLECPPLPVRREAKRGGSVLALLGWLRGA